MDEARLPATVEAAPVVRPARGRTPGERRSPSRAESDRRSLGQGDPVSPSDIFCRTVDLGVASVIALTPFLFGGRHPWGRIALLTLTFATCIVWMVRQTRTASAPHRSSWGVWIVVAGVLIGVMQISSVPNHVWKWLDPAAAELLPLWTEGGPDLNFGTWRQLSLAPNESKASLAFFACYGLLFWVVLQRVQSVADVERILATTAFVATVMAIFGLVQYYAGNGKFFWFYEHPFTDTHPYVKGSFPNRNHFAHFLALGFAPAAWGLMRALDAASRVKVFRAHGGTTARNDLTIGLAGLAVGAILFATVASLSRGGTIAVVLSGGVFAAVLGLRSHLQRHLIAGLAVAGLAAAGLVFVSGGEEVGERMATLASAEIEDLDRNSLRREIWSANVEGFSMFPIFGAGLGSHRDVYPVFWKGAWDHEFTHAENGYLQVALETGLVGLTVLVAGLVLTAVWCIGAVQANDRRLATASAAVAATLAASAAHAAVDFTWYVPACSAVVAVFAACACRLFQKTYGDATTRPLPRLVWVAAAAGVFLIASYALPPAVAQAQAEPDRHKYLLAAARPSLDVPRTTWLNHLRRRLEAVVRRDPNDARSHLRLAAVHLALFEERQKTADNSMGLLEIRDAVSSSNFSSQQELTHWLGRAIGEPGEHLIAARESTMRAIRRSPLLGQAYVYLAQLAFLQLNGDRHVPALVNQALRVRPRDAEVLFAAGQEALLVGNTTEAIKTWGESLRRSERMRGRVLDVLVGRVPTAEVAALLPRDERLLRELVDRVRTLGRPAELHAALTALTETTTDLAKMERGADAARSWTKVVYYAWELGEPERADAALKAGISAEPYNYTLHRLAVQHALAQGNLAAAEDRLRWLQQRRPHDPDVLELVGQVEAHHRTAASPFNARRM